MLVPSFASATSAYESATPGRYESSRATDLRREALSALEFNVDRMTTLAYQITGGVEGGDDVDFDLLDSDIERVVLELTAIRDRLNPVAKAKELTSRGCRTIERSVRCQCKL